MRCSLVFVLFLVDDIKPFKTSLLFHPFLPVFKLINWSILSSTSSTSTPALNISVTVHVIHWLWISSTPVPSWVYHWPVWITLLVVIALGTYFASFIPSSSSFSRHRMSIPSPGPPDINSRQVQQQQAHHQSTSGEFELLFPNPFQAAFCCLCLRLVLLANILLLQLQLRIRAWHSESLQMILAFTIPCHSFLLCPSHYYLTHSIYLLIGYISTCSGHAS